MGDKDYFAMMVGAMKVLNFSETEMWNIWKIVALVMHLGNIDFGGIYIRIYPCTLYICKSEKRNICSECSNVCHFALQ